MIASSLAELLRQYFNMDQLTSEIVASAIVFGLIVFIGWIACLIFRKYLTKWAEKTKTKLDDEILRSTEAPVLLLAILVGAYYSLESLTFLDPYSELFTAIFTIAEILAITFIITRVTNVLVSWYAARAKRGRKMSEHLLFILKKAVQAVVYIFAFLAILVAFKIDLSGVVIGLGVGGIAIALALQNILSDVFSAFSIYFDRPFEVGDFISCR